MISIIIPAYNEENNLPNLLDSILTLGKRKGMDFEIIVVNDNSSDNTREISEKYSKKHKNIRTINREKGDNGMGFALIEGSKKAKGDIIAWVMGDASDDLRTVPKFIEKINDGFDVVFGSRYMKGGSSGDLEFSKRLASNGFSFLSKLFIGVKVHDITNAFRAFRKDVFVKIELRSGDFGISPEFALKAHLNGFKLGEVPTTYKCRESGVAKFKMFKMSRRYFSIFSRAFLMRCFKIFS
ncbi:MAG: glycosyltransferase [Candidatus Aenigmarchaeota archaeon]|nr:glycosyltransferase [Candidatus Aenigmarchaeota archaeon]